MVPFDIAFTHGNSPVTFYDPAWDIFKNDPQGEIGRNFHNTGRRIVVAAKIQVGKDTGDLMRSIDMVHSRVGAYQEIWVGSENDIALIHHDGTRPHAITARNAQYLRFSQRGRIVYTRSVLHPGTKPNKYLSDNLYLAYV